MSPEVMDLLDNLKQVVTALSGLSKEKASSYDENLNKEEFRLMMEKSAIKRKIEKQIKNLEKDPTKIFIVNRIKKSMENF